MIHKWLPGDYKVVRKESYKGALLRDWKIDKEGGYFIFPALKSLARKEWKKRDEVRIIITIKELRVRPVSKKKKLTQKLYRKTKEFKEKQRIYNLAYRQKQRNMDKALNVTLY